MQIITHHVNGANNELKIETLDERGPGGAFHAYKIEGFDRKVSSDEAGIPSARFGSVFHQIGVNLYFQKGAIKEVGVNGITEATLIAIILDRLISFQQGPYQCEENGDAIKHLFLARQALADRTQKRTERGVEGTMKA